MKIIIALLIFGIIVFVHELGHFLLAKANGIFVEEFSIGMGPKLFSFVKGDTRYCIKLLPLGGSCMMMGEDEESDDARAFNNKSVWARIAVVFAGPFFNFVFAFLLAIVLIALVGADVPGVISVESGSPAQEAGLQEGDVIVSYNNSRIGVGREIYVNDYFHPLGEEEIPITFKRDGQTYNTILQPEKISRYYLGINYSNNSSPATVSVVEGGAMESAGLQDGDVITGINDVSIASGEEFYEYVSQHELTSEEVQITYERDGAENTVGVTPTKSEYYSAGFTYNCNYKDGNKKVGILGNLKYSLLEIRYQIKSVILSLKHLIMGNVSADSVAGPVGIVNMVGDVYSESAQYGLLAVFESLASFCIMLSANLGIMNLLPIPALDGGRLLFMLVEVIRGKKIDPNKEGFVHFIGFVLLMGLMVVVMFNDIRNIFIK
ncbi:MAG: RIP metalloprotease RseP [Lachnospiraceae bacterium]|nr:RIP metalloprotease RseP [Lachnospiraceae bacterium]